jgi:hypothetical protein
MKIRLSSMAAGFAALLVVTACSKKDNAATIDSPAAATPVTPVDTTPKMIEVGDIDMGRHISADKKISDKTDDFGPKDTIYASINTKNAGTAKLTARWTFEDGKVVHEESQTITPTGDATTEFHIAKPSGWPAGKYTLHLLMNDAEVKTKDITVKKP